MTWVSVSSFFWDLCCQVDNNYWGNSYSITWKGSGRIMNKDHSVDGGEKEEGSRFCLELIPGG